jgi:molecular chaperone HscB
MYQLTLAGVDLNQETATTRDGAFLMAQMELREALSEVEQTSDPFASLDSLMRDIRLLLQQQLESLSAQLNDGSEEALKDAQEAVSKLQFLTKLQREAEAVEAKLEEAR